MCNSNSGDSSFVITGSLTALTKEKAYAIIKQNGEMYSKDLIKKGERSTDFLVIAGTQRKEVFADGDKSEKHKKALKWREEGHKIQIISEEEFFRMMGL